MRAPTPSAAAELASGERAGALETIRDLTEDFTQAVRGRIERYRLLLRPFSIEDLEYRFRAILQPRLVRFDDAKESLITNLSALVAELRRRLELVLAVLEAGSPLAVMERGFSLVTNSRTGKIVRYAEDAKPGDRLNIRPLKGKITAVTEECYGENC
jgi:exodeoxyribonuclease VII large subunit